MGKKKNNKKKGSPKQSPGTFRDRRKKRPHPNSSTSPSVDRTSYQKPKKKQKNSSLKTKNHHHSEPSHNNNDHSKEQQQAAVTRLPQPFPYHDEKYPLPKDDFLRDIPPYHKSFQEALDTSFQGFATDLYDESKTEATSSSTTTTTAKKNNATKQIGGASQQEQYFNHDAIQEAFDTLNDHGIFRTDVTQPFGLGTKCAKTYVTRCLVGEEGCTYKYLGLRMFAYPWTSVTNGSNSSSKQASNSSSLTDLKNSFQVLATLNQDLTKRTKFHLQALDEKRLNDESSKNNNNRSTLNGRAKFDIALINRMTNAPDLKMEPSPLGERQNEKCSVSWHADSSLEHFSTIGVYHTIVPDLTTTTAIETNGGKGHKKKIANSNSKSNDNDTMATQWSIALRIAHNAEGPTISSKKKGEQQLNSMDTTTTTNTSPILAVSLPSKSAYYLLDDFNHHHQHAVLVKGNNTNNDNNTASSTVNAGIRYASTHRLLRESHNVHYVMERCRTAISQFHRKGAKIWRSEQLLLTDMESDWIRQFYIQNHPRNTYLWECWKEPMMMLLKYWGQLEQRTKQVIDLLTFAADARYEANKSKENLVDETNSKNEIPSRSERKLREKKKKSLSTVEDLMKRGGVVVENMDQNIVDTLYEPFCVLLDERAKMRSLWSEREKDGVFHSMSSDYKPMPVPFVFNKGVNVDKKGSSTDDCDSVSSPLVGTSKELEQLSDNLRRMSKRAYLSLDFVSDEEANNDVSSSSIDKDDSKEEKRKEDNEVKSNEKETTIVERPIFNKADHSMSLTWKGWNSIKTIGLEMQEPWAGFLLNGSKSIETRAYDLPKALIGKKIDILQSKRGKDGVSSLTDVIVGEQEIDSAVQRVGWCIFDKVIVYRYKKKFISDEKKHLVKADSDYGWNDETTKVIYGWVVSKYGTMKKKQRKKSKPKVLVRRMRSLYEMQH